MEEIREKLNEREDYLLQLREEKKIALQKTPEGALRVCNSGGKRASGNTKI